MPDQPKPPMTAEDMMNYVVRASEHEPWCEMVTDHLDRWRTALLASVPVPKRYTVVSSENGYQYILDSVNRKVTECCDEEFSDAAKAVCDCLNAEHEAEQERVKAWPGPEPEFKLDQKVVVRVGRREFAAMVTEVNYHPTPDPHYSYVAFYMEADHKTTGRVGAAYSFRAYSDRDETTKDGRVLPKEREPLIPVKPDPRDVEIARLTVERDALIDAVVYRYWDTADDPQPDNERWGWRTKRDDRGAHSTRDEAIAALMAHVMREALDGITPKKGE